ncbi:MAG: PEP-CTERM sorting domain-containing protein [Cyanobacteria bacterium P01_A01_bin.37]
MLNQFKGCVVAMGSIIGLTVAIAQPASAINVRGIEFSMGESSFADEVIDFNKYYANGLNQTDAYAQNWNASAEAFDDPNSVLGIANSSWKENRMAISERDDFSLGRGGSITVKFTDNFLVGSNNDADDLWIFEAGGLVEGMFVEISTDGDTWESLGEIGGTQHAGIDIDAFGFSSADRFSFVRVTDNSRNRYRQGWAGADIDAIGAISSKDVPEPASLLGLLVMGGMAAGSTSLKRRQR